MASSNNDRSQAGVGWKSPLPSSSVHTLQTKAQEDDGSYIRHAKFGSPEFDVQGVTPTESVFRHSGWAVKRLQVWLAFARTAQSDGRRSKFANCGSGLWLEQQKNGQDVRLRCNCCGDRFCIPCQNARAVKMRETITRLIDQHNPRLVTLTLRHSDTPLKAQIDRLYDSFNKLRRSEFWKGCVSGGAAFLEIKLGDKDGRWHPHLHCLVCTDWIDQKQLSLHWHSITGDSSIVDVRPISNPEIAGSYVTKYVTKPADQSVFNVPDRLDEFMIAMRGRRLCLTFGSWRGEKLEADPPDDVEWISSGSISSLQQQAREGSAWAKGILLAAARKYPLFGQMFQIQPPSTENANSS